MATFEPVDYSSSFNNLPSPGDSFMQGLKNGAGIQQLQMQQQAQQNQMLRMQQMQKAAAQVAANPTPESIAQLSIAFPEMSEQFKRSYDMLQPQQQRADLQHMTGVYAALQNNRPDVASQLLRDRAEALKNSGASSMMVNAANAMADWAEQHPDTLKTSSGVMLASVMGPEKFGQTFKDIGEGQLSQNTLGEKTESAALSNRNLREDAETKALKRELDVLDTQIKQANSETTRGELQVKRDELNLKYGQLQQERQTVAQDQMDTLQRGLSAVDGLLKHPGLQGFFYGAGTIGGKTAALVPGTDAFDFRAQLDNLKSQTFMNEISKMRGMGALSDAEGKKIADAVANLSADQSEKQLKTSLKFVRSTMERAQQRLIGSGNLQTQGGPGGGGAFVFKSPTYGVVRDSDINRLLQQFPGSTREQVIQFLQSSSGGK